LRAVSNPRRHALLFATQFFAFGVILPFLPAVLAARGMTPTEVATALAMGSALRLVAGPMGGRLADALGGPRIVLALGAAAAALAALGFLAASGFALLLLAYAAMSVAMAPIVPLTDAAAVAAARREGFDYGRVRSAGSVAFILAALAAGQAVALFGTEAATLMIAGALAATALAALALPAGPAPPAGGRGGLAGFLAPLATSGFRRLVLLSALIHGSHAFYYAFGTLHWQAAGLDEGLIGALWATGVIAETVLFFWGRGVVQRLGPVGLAMVAAAAGLLRWCAMALTDDPLLLFPLQVLHAGSFGAVHLAAMMVLGRIVPAQQAGTAQTLHAALGIGLPMGVLTLACGPLFAAFGGGGYLAMALLCAAAIPAALALGAALRR
jgi:PPP family 3-phenylpropionic acid transporter